MQREQADKVCAVIVVGHCVLVLDDGVRCTLPGIAVHDGDGEHALLGEAVLRQTGLNIYVWNAIGGMYRDRNQSPARAYLCYADSTQGCHGNVRLFELTELAHQSFGDERERRMALDAISVQKEAERIPIQPNPRSVSPDMVPSPDGKSLQVMRYNYLLEWPRLDPALPGGKM
jgi:hypothetical protein